MSPSTPSVSSYMAYRNGAGLAAQLFQEKHLLIAFDISLILKALFAAAQTIGGIIVLFTSKQAIFEFVRRVTQEELLEDPRDFVATYLLHSAHTLSIGTQHFVALYLLSHGIVKLWLIIGLLRKKLWYYPAALIVFGLLMVYQLYLLALNHSPWLLAVIALDVIVLALTVHEYRYRRRIATHAR